MRRIMLAGVIAITMASFVSQTAWEAPKQIEGNSVEAGHKLALYLCSTCHAVDPKQEFSPALINPAPSFLEISNRPGTTTESLQRFLAARHGHGDISMFPAVMPDLMLTDMQKDTAVAYIMSLRNKPRASSN